MYVRVVYDRCLVDLFLSRRCLVGVLKTSGELEDDAYRFLCVASSRVASRVPPFVVLFNWRARELAIAV